jgi:hypothetical protein
VEQQQISFGTGVQIRWLDSSLSEGWQYGFKEHTASDVSTLGYVTANSPKALTISSHVSVEQKADASAFTVPWSAIYYLELLPENFAL